MRNYVLTRLAVLCLTGHLLLGEGHTQGQRDSAGFETAENLTLPRVANDSHESLNSNNRRWNASQPPLSKEDDTLETFQEGNTTSLIWDAGISASQGVAPVVSDHFVFMVGPQEDVVTTPQEVSISTLKNMISTGQNDMFNTIPEDIYITTPYENIISTTPQEDIISIYQKHNTVTPQEGITTTPQNITTTPQEDITTSPLQETTTLQEDINTFEESGSEQKAKTVVMDPVLEDGQVPIRVDQVVICSCLEMTPDGCRRFLSDTYINAKSYEYEDIKVRKQCHRFHN